MSIGYFATFLPLFPIPPGGIFVISNEFPVYAGFSPEFRGNFATFRGKGVYFSPLKKFFFPNFTAAPEKSVFPACVPFPMVSRRQILPGAGLDATEGKKFLEYC